MPVDTNQQPDFFTDDEFCHFWNDLATSENGLMDLRDDPNEGEQLTLFPGD